MNNQEASKKISIKDFFDLWKKTIKEIKPDWSIYPETSIQGSVSSSVTPPIITYKIRKRKTAERSGRKPHYKKRFKNKNQDGNMVTEYSQRFESIIEFGIYSTSYQNVNKIREEFEETMLDYFGHFREEGILSLIFEEQKEDEVFKLKDNYLSKQTLTYFIKNEDVTVLTNNKIKEVRQTLDLPDDYKLIKSSFDKNN